MTTATTKATGQTEHAAVTEARAALAMIRHELADVEAAAARIERGDIVAMHPVAARKKAFVEEQAAAERSLRTLWSQHEAPRLIKAGYGDVIAATEDYMAAVANMHAARTRAVEARAAFNATFQASRAGVPSESNYSLNTAPPSIAAPELDARNLATWVARVHREARDWATSWGGTIA